MSEIKKIDPEYNYLLLNIKAKIPSSQLKVAIVANSAVLIFYWELGNMIVEKQLSTKWGDKLKKGIVMKETKTRVAFFTTQLRPFENGSIHPSLFLVKFNLNECY